MLHSLTFAGRGYIRPNDCYLEFLITISLSINLDSINFDLERNRSVLWDSTLQYRTRELPLLLVFITGLNLFMFFFSEAPGSPQYTFSSRDHFIKINVIIKINASVDVHSWFPGECPCPVTLTHRFQYCKIDGIMMKCTLVGLTENNDPIFLDSQTWTYCFHPV